LAKKRSKLPPKTEVEILFINDRTCCVCRDKTKGVQIHHIDDNPLNNEIENLAVVCTDDHDKIHKKGGITKGFPPELIKKYKYSWEKTVRDRRTSGYKPLTINQELEKVLFNFEIRKTAFELSSLDDHNIKGIDERLEYLYQLHMLEGYTPEILESIEHIIILPSITNKNKPSKIAEKMYEFCWHLVGPDKIPIDKEDILNLKTIIRILSSIGNFSGEFNRNFKTIKNVAKSFEFILNVSIWYNLEEIASISIDEIKKVKKACKSTFKGQSPLTKGIEELNKILDNFQKSARRNKIKWINKLENKI